VRPIRGSRFWLTWTIILGVTFVAGLAALTLWQWPRTLAVPQSVEVAEPSFTPSPEVETPEFTHPAPLASIALTEEAVDSVGAGWFAVQYDSTAPGIIAGPDYLYLVDPGGAVYGDVVLPRDSTWRLLALLPDGRSALVAQYANQPKPSASPSVDSDIPEGPAQLRIVDMVTGDQSEVFASPDSAGWVLPRVVLARDNVSFLVQHGQSSRAIDRVSFEGELQGRLVPPVSAGTFIEAPRDGRIYVQEEASAGDPDSGSVIVSYGVDSNGTRDRQYHAQPAGYQNCFPEVWPLGRQLIVRCVVDDQTSQLFTLAPATNTYAEASTIQWPTADDFRLDSSASRIAVSRALLDVFGSTLWEVPPEAPTTSFVAWAGDSVVMWGNPQDPTLPASFVRAHRSATGQAAFVLSAYLDAAGFMAVAPAPE